LPDKSQLVERFRLFNEEKRRLLAVLDKEVVPEGKLQYQNPNSLEHITNVVDVINLAVAHASSDDLSTVKSRLTVARQFVSELRNSSAKLSESLILRDAERYLWARSGSTELSSLGPSQWDWYAGFGKSLYNVGKAFDLITGLSLFKSNKNLPYSAM